ncbi:hypothetical protein H696_05666 [Fonticula alba]|uniref:Uncharacterized protein n=1 Tax=Fonticula alba TaxID=691883 RepID=A0A058Z1E4_FONAL|nr:hypothetical protein H696_05666 [Fonticula alba]KCV67941.1 hypothetical protein H696_05666 [Fonticula alba]|eukprot:XP_009497761.1 hypothetical protein H696_05666 [Fonticula alba]
MSLTAATPPHPAIVFQTAVDPADTLRLQATLTCLRDRCLLNIGPRGSTGGAPPQVVLLVSRTGDAGAGASRHRGPLDAVRPAGADAQQDDPMAASGTYDVLLLLGRRGHPGFLGPGAGRDQAATLTMTYDELTQLVARQAAQYVADSLAARHSAVSPPALSRLLVSLNLGDILSQYDPQPGDSEERVTSLEMAAVSSVIDSVRRSLESLAVV